MEAKLQRPKRKKNSWVQVSSDWEAHSSSCALLSPSRETGPFNSLQSSFHKGRKRPSAPYSGGLAKASFQSDRYCGFRSKATWTPTGRAEVGRKIAMEKEKWERVCWHQETTDLVTKCSLQDTLRSGKHKYEIKAAGGLRDSVHLSLLAPWSNIEPAVLKPWVYVIQALLFSFQLHLTLINAQLCEPRIRSGQGNQWLTTQKKRGGEQ